MRPSRLPWVVLALTALAAPPAHAVRFAVAPPVVVTSAGEGPVVVALGQGRAALAYGGPGVYVSRSVPGAAWTPPEKLSGDVSFGVRIAANARGDLAVSWHVATGQNTPQTLMRVAFAPAGAAFGPAQDVPLPPRAPKVHENVVEHAHGTSGLNMVLGPGGEAVAGYLEGDYAADAERAVAVRRSAAGEFAEPQILGEEVLRGPMLAMDGAGVAHALWVRPTDPAVPRSRRLHAALAAPGGPFGAPDLISEPDLDADIGVGTPQLSVNARGDALAVWNPTPLGGMWMMFPDRASAAVRPAGGSWSPPSRVSADNRGVIRPTGAIGAAGHSVLAWHGGQTIAGAAAVLGGAFAPVGGPALGPSSVEELPIGVDEAGDAVTVHRADGANGGRSPQIFAYARGATGCFGGRTAVSQPPTNGSPPALAMAADGTGVIAWTHAGGIHAAAFDVDPDGAAYECAVEQKPGAPVAGPPFTLSLGKLGKTMKASTLRSRGLRVTFTASRSARAAAVLTLQAARRKGRRGAPKLAADSLLPYGEGRRTVRLRVPARMRSQIRPGAVVTVVVAAAETTGAKALAQARITLR